MGKKDSEQSRAAMLEEVMRHVHDARDVLNALAQALVHDGETGVAGRIFVLAEVLRAGALDLRIDFTGAADTIPPPPLEKPKRGRPRKPRASAASRTLPMAGTEDGVTAPGGAS